MLGDGTEYPRCSAPLPWIWKSFLARHWHEQKQCGFEVQITFKLPKLLCSEAIDWQHLLQFGDLRWWPRPKIWNPHRPLKSWRNALDLAVFQLVALLKPSRVSGDCTLEAAPCNAFTTLGLKARHMDPEVQKWFAMFKFRRLESSYAAFPRRFFMTLRLDFGVGCDWPQPLLAIFTNRLQACLQPLYLEQARNFETPDFRLTAKWNAANVCHNFHWFPISTDLVVLCI